MEVKIWGCNLASAESYVQQVANGLNSPVTVADKYVWFKVGETPSVAGRTLDWFGSSGVARSTSIVRPLQVVGKPLVQGKSCEQTDSNPCTCI